MKLQLKMAELAHLGMGSANEIRLNSTDSNGKHNKGAMYFQRFM